VGRSFVVGVQCHPEELWNGTEPRWAHLFQGFVSVAGATGDRVTG
jgi:putative glutamine amidotransferase